MSPSLRRRCRCHWSYMIENQWDYCYIWPSQRRWKRVRDKGRWAILFPSSSCLGIHQMNPCKIAMEAFYQPFFVFCVHFLSFLITKIIKVDSELVSSLKDVCLGLCVCGATIEGTIRFSVRWSFGSTISWSKIILWWIIWSLYLDFDSIIEILYIFLHHASWRITHQDHQQSYAHMPSTNVRKQNYKKLMINTTTKVKINAGESWRKQDDRRMKTLRGMISELRARSWVF